MTNTDKTAKTAKTPATHDDAALRNAWPVLANWGKDKADGPAPSPAALRVALAMGCRAGSGQGLALTMTLRDGGSTRAQRIRANSSGVAYGTKPADNVGGLGDALRTAYGKGVNFDPAKAYPVTAGRVTVAVVCGPHGHRTARPTHVDGMALTGKTHDDYLTAAVTALAKAAPVAVKAPAPVTAPPAQVKAA